mmetsp:Transcript_92386/g.298581  ORF Transcript_92386/g.298581 Transcript_92386/m.298581 type:complete len:202 (-) Transcript_92386:471-1076(-)
MEPDSKSFCASFSSPRRTVALKLPKLPAWYTSLPSEVNWMTSEHTWSKKTSSCEMIIAVPPDSPPMQVPLMNSTSHCTPATSRWFVGSSSNSKFAFWATAHAKAKRICQPPLRPATAFSSISSPKPTPARALATASSDVTSASPLRWRVYSRAVVDGSTPCKILSWLKWAILIVSGKPTISFRAILPMSVDFPEPFDPTTP